MSRRTRAAGGGGGGGVSEFGTNDLGGYLNHVNINQIMQMGMRALPTPITLPASNVWNTFVSCGRFWIIFYAFWLLFLDIFFTIFPTTLLCIAVLTLALHYTKIPTPPIQFLNAVFGVNPYIHESTNVNALDRNNNASNYQYDEENSEDIVKDLATALLGTALNSAIPLPLVMGSTNPALAKMAINVLKKGLQQNKPNTLSQNQSQSRSQLGKQPASGSTETSLSDGYRTPTPDPILEQGLPQTLEAQLSNIPVAVIARRGAGLDVPENSIKAIAYCKEKNCHFVHFDVRLTWDNVAVVFHDKDLVRMAGIDRKVRYMSSQEIRNIDVSFLHPRGERFRGAMVPSFDQAIEACIKQNIKFFFNVVGSSKEMVEIVLRAYRTYKAMYSMAVLTSFSWKVIYNIRRRDSKIIACLATPYAHRYKPCHALEPGFNEGEHKQHHVNRGIVFMEWYYQLNDNLQDWLLESFLWWYLGICAILIEKESASKSCIREWGSRGVHTFLWSVNNPVEKLYLNQVLKVGYLTDTIAEDPVLHPHLDPTMRMTPRKDTDNSHKKNSDNNSLKRTRSFSNSSSNSANSSDRGSISIPQTTGKHVQLQELESRKLLSIPPSPSLEDASSNSDSLDLIKTLNAAAAKLEEQRKQRYRQDQQSTSGNGSKFGAGINTPSKTEKKRR